MVGSIFNRKYQGSILYKHYKISLEYFEIDKISIKWQNKYIGTQKMFQVATINVYRIATK